MKFATPREDAPLRRAPSRAMGSYRARLVAAAMLLVITRGHSEALTAASVLQIGAVIDLRCSIITQPLPFGTYDPQSAIPRDATADVSFNCTSSNGPPIRARIEQGSNPAAGSTNGTPLRQMSNGTGGLLRYDIYQDAGRTQVWGATGATDAQLPAGVFSANLTMYGRIPASQAVPPGDYLDVVNVRLWF